MFVILIVADIFISLIYSFPFSILELKSIYPPDGAGWITEPTIVYQNILLNLIICYFLSGLIILILDKFKSRK